VRPSGAKHDCSLPQLAIDKMMRRCGRRYGLEMLMPRRTALVVIDLMQDAMQTPCAASIVVWVGLLPAGAIS
jgi:hypothetical protein